MLISRWAQTWVAWPQFGLAAGEPPVDQLWSAAGFEASGSIMAAYGLLFCLSIIQKNFHFSDRRWELRVHYIHSQPEELLSLPQNKIWKNFFPPCDLWIEWNRDLNSSLKVSRLLSHPLRAKLSHYRFLFPPLEAWLHCKLHRDGLHVFMELCAVTHWPSL